jgi:hypothetical protein
MVQQQRALNINKSAWRIPACTDRYDNLLHPELPAVKKLSGIQKQFAYFSGLFQNVTDE